MVRSGAAALPAAARPVPGVIRLAGLTLTRLTARGSLRLGRPGPRAAAASRTPAPAEMVQAPELRLGQLQGGIGASGGLPNRRLKLAGAAGWSSMQSNPPVQYQWNDDLLQVARSLSAIR